MSLRTENKNTLDSTSLTYNKPQNSLNSAKTDDTLLARSQMQRMPKMQAMKKTGMLDEKSMKLGSVDEE